MFPPGSEDLWLPVHALHLMERGVPQGQNRNLEKLSTACGETGHHAFPLSATPEPFTGATGSSVAPVAVPPAGHRPRPELDGGAALLAPSPPARAATLTPALPPRLPMALKEADAESRLTLAEGRRRRGPRRPLTANRCPQA